MLPFAFFGLQFNERIKATGSAFFVLLIFSLIAVSQIAYAQNLNSENWIGTWGASPQPEKQSFPLNGQTLRQIVRVSAGGSSLRLRFSNLFGDSDVNLGSVHLALHGSGANTIPGTDHLVLFHGNSELMVPAHEEIVSDPISMEIQPLTELAISLYIPYAVAPSTNHVVASQTCYLSVPGDFASYNFFPSAGEGESWFFLTGVDVLASNNVNTPAVPDSNGNQLGKTIVALGDSITDGVCSDTNGNARWPDYLAERLNSNRFLNWGVLNEGIGSNRVLTDTINSDQPSVSAQRRLQRDVINRPGVNTVIMLEGINDIGAVDPSMSVDQEVKALQIAYRNIIHQLKSQGLRIFFATLTPIGNANMDSPQRRAIRNQLNAWFRTSSEFDGFIDFDAAIRDSKNPERMNPAYDCGDHLHPNSDGYQAMANSIDLIKLTQETGSPLPPKTNP